MEKIFKLAYDIHDMLQNSDEYKILKEKEKIMEDDQTLLPLFALYKKAQEERITNLEEAVDNLFKEINDNQDSLYKKQKVYHEQSIQIRDQLRENQDGLKNSLDEIKSLIINNSIESMRWEILDFSSSIMAGREFNKEQYDHVLNTHERYEKILEENDMTNGQTTASFEFIKKHYDELMEKGFVSLSSKDNGVK